MKNTFALTCFLLIIGACREAPKSTEGMTNQKQVVESSWGSVVSKDGSKPVQRHEAAFVKVEDKFYLLGGRGIRPVSIYDTQTQKWTQGMEPPIEIHHFQPVVHKNRIYIVGAFTGAWPNETPVRTIYIYDPLADNWSKGDEIPSERLRGSTGNVIYDGKIYVSCGIKNGHIGDHKNWMDSYDLNTGEWKVLADAPRPRDHFQSVEANGKIYVLAGRNTGASDEPFGSTLGKVDVYDIASNSWNTLPNDIPTQRAGNMAILQGNEILVLGGESSNQEKAHAHVEALAFGSNTWRSLPSMIEGRHGTGVLEYEGNLYVASGCGNRGGEPELYTMEKYTR
ncbi:kelch repeat-containing protein [Ulvibacterium sp.]|uniref:Kelch repeat-containing protein n=1 Tax=Ulvibacterium sp. TaxID=2665914 RepID=UPI00261EDE23|nr:kelch repeat-containing protein [Ulvibacterium sp.]